MPTIFDKPDDGTSEALLNPRVGDRFTEMYSFDLFVVYVDGDTVATLECSRSYDKTTEMPRDGVLRVQSRTELEKRLSYSSGGYWMDLAERGFNVNGWYEYAIEKEASDKLTTR